MTGGDRLDPRRHAYRDNLAAAELRNRIEAPRYAAGERRQLRVPVLPLRREPRFDATLDSEALFGESLRVFEESEGWAWVQLERDGYVGYMEPYATSHQALDRDKAMQQETTNAARALGNAVRLSRAGRLENPAAELEDPVRK